MGVIKWLHGTEDDIVFLDLKKKITYEKNSIIKTPLKGNIKFKYTTSMTSQ